jgi:hypothetical protein
MQVLYNVVLIAAVELLYTVVNGVKPTIAMGKGKR